MRHIITPLIALLVAATAFAPRRAAAQSFAVSDVRVFDGERVIPAATVLIRDGRIEAVGPGVTVPAGVARVDGTGHTLLPGLIDAHTHTFMPDALEAALSYGVTTVLDMFGGVEQTAAWRAEQADGAASSRADIFSAGTLVTATGGHGTQFGMPIPTLDAPGDARAFIDARIAEGSDFIKLVRDDGRVYGFGPIPTLDTASLAAAIAATRAHDRSAVVHVGTLADARLAVRAGAHGLVHLWVDSIPSDAFVAELKQAGVFVVPTATVYEALSGSTAADALSGDEWLTPWLGPDERDNLGRGLQLQPGARANFNALMASLTKIAAAGVPVLTGSDAPNPGTAHGVSVHRELELLVRAGLSPVEALRAATSAPADAFGLTGRGRIAPGARADLVLVEGDPATDIAATRAIVSVWKGGVAYDRDARRAAIAARIAEGAAPIAAPVEIGETGVLLAGFDDGAIHAAFGAGWITTTDAMMGGSSTAAHEVTDGGANGTSHALRIHGEIAPGLAFAWAGTMVFPGAQPMAPANLSAARGFAFHARSSTGGEWRVMLFTRSSGQVPLVRTFSPGDDWAEHVFAWSDFGASDGSDVTGVAIVAGPAPGAFEMLLDEVRLVR